MLRFIGLARPGSFWEFLRQSARTFGFAKYAGKAGLEVKEPGQEFAIGRRESGGGGSEVDDARAGGRHRGERVLSDRVDPWRSVVDAPACSSAKSQTEWMGATRLLFACAL
jgi:hypothetical protein